ncbi:hypothetical protein E4U56_002534 [Claviceps arundinis]|uniref:Zn(2)-C6 fungal-type domain-containing protein n=1 Tax=Claviceps arundinis TaxID=1623583 RepID=A0A9P7MPV1_9HYPO|nr:hypothetical protein E4U56_002534 [Claviceps arundinis]
MDPGPVRPAGAVGVFADDSQPAPVGGSPAPAQEPPPASKRRLTAPFMPDCCRTCRLRKVKCSGKVGWEACSNCARLDLQCSFISTWKELRSTIARSTPSHSHTEAGTLRKRAQRACSQCHAHKTKCSGDLPRCKRCVSGGWECEYRPAKRRFTGLVLQRTEKEHAEKDGHGSHGQANVNESNANDTATATTGHYEPDFNTTTSTHRLDAVASVSPPSSNTGSSGHSLFPLITEGSNLLSDDMLVRRDLLLRHVDAYMDNMYWLPSQGFLHPKSTYTDIENGLLDPVVAAAVCGITSVFVSPNDSGGEFGVKCSAYVEMHLFHNLGHSSDQNLVLLALSITINLVRGEFAKVWQWFDVASRLVMELRLNWDVFPPDRSFVQQESLRRIVWHLFYLDRMLAGGSDEYIAYRADDMKIALPCTEAAYQEDRAVRAERLYDKPGAHPSTINIHAYQLRLIDLRHRIQVTTKRLCGTNAASHSQTDASSIMANINGLQNELTRFHMSLPPDLLLSDQTVTKYMASPQRAGYVFLHAHLAISHMELYRFSLPGQRDKVSADILRRLPREFVARSQKQAIAHAMCLARFYDAIQTEVDQRDHGMGELPSALSIPLSLPLAGDYSTFLLSTHCVRFLLIALQYELFRGVAHVTTAPLWRSVEGDETHLYFLLESVQRVVRPWGCILKVAQQAYDHNAALVEEFKTTRNVPDQDQRITEIMSSSSNLGVSSNHLPGPDIILESIATGIPEADLLSRRSSPSLTYPSPWMQRHPEPPRPHIFAPRIASRISADSRPGGHTPGVSLFLEQSGNEASKPLQVPFMYDNEGDRLPVPVPVPVPVAVGDWEGATPAVQSFWSGAGMRSGDDLSSVFQDPITQTIPQPGGGFLAGQQGVFGGDTYAEQYDAGQHAQSAWPHSSGQGYC